MKHETFAQLATSGDEQKTLYVCTDEESVTHPTFKHWTKIVIFSDQIYICSIWTMMTNISPLTQLCPEGRVGFSFSLSLNIPCRLQAEADFFSRVSLADFNIICTLGMGGFSRVELVSMSACEDALRPPITHRRTCWAHAVALHVFRCS